jgi:23S rRNA pseudouridine1911/1915/1917 synthase
LKPSLKKVSDTLPAHNVNHVSRVNSEEVLPDDTGQRLDRWLAGRLMGTHPELSRARVQALIRDGQVSNGATTIREANHRVKPGEIYTLNVPDAETGDVVAEEIALQVVYEDGAVIVIDKPPGMVVHPAAGHASGTLVNALLAHCGESLSGIGGVKRPGIVHRLDKDTSGLLVVAKTDAAHKSLGEQFKSHGADGRLRRVYRALVWGVLDRPAGTIDAPLTRSSANRKKISVTRSSIGRHAVTHYRVIETFDGADKKGAASLLELQLETGRTHQIRVHLAHIGHPVMGDQVYGTGFKTQISLLTERAKEALEALGRQALHAAELEFEHPEALEQLAFASEIPPDIQHVIDALRAPAAAAKKYRVAKTGPPAKKPKKLT